MGFLGTSKKYYWSAFAIEIGGEYVPGGWFKKEYIKYPYLHWEIFIDSHTGPDEVGETGTYTRFRAYISNPRNFSFRISRKKFDAGSEKFGDLYEIRVGDPDFDSRFVIKANRTDQVLDLFADQGLKDAIALPRDLNLYISDYRGQFRKKGIPYWVDTLMIRKRGDVYEKEDLRMYVEILTKTLYRLAEIGAIENEHPGVSIYAKR